MKITVKALFVCLVLFYFAGSRLQGLDNALVIHV